MDFQRRIRVYEKRLTSINRPIPPAEYRVEIGDVMYLDYLMQQINVFEHMQSFVPRYYVACEEQTNKNCDICLADIIVGDEISCFECQHFMHSHCLVSYLESPFTRTKCCPFCREPKIILMIQMVNSDDDDEEEEKEGEQ
jgi:hypothetical protein